MKISIGHLTRIPVLKRILLLAILITASFSQVSNAQIYATEEDSDSDNETILIYTATASVSNPTAVLDEADGVYTTLSASGLVATELITVTSSAYTTMTLEEAVPAGKSSFIKIKRPTRTGLSVNLSELVNVLGLLKNRTIDVTTDGGGTVSYNLVSGPGADNFYIQVTSSLPYQSVTVTLDFANGLGLLGIGLGRINLEIDNITTFETDDLAACAIPSAFAGADPDLDLDGTVSNTILEATLTNAIQNPNNAVDGNFLISNFSILQNGNLSVASTVSQSFHLAQTVPGSYEVVAALSAPAGIANITALSGITIQAFNGNAPAGPARTLSSFLLNVTLLQFQSNVRFAVFSPGEPYNRIVITSVAVASVLTSLRIHEISSRPPITFTGGRLPSATAGDGVNVNINQAVAVQGEATLPGFTIGCGGQSNYSYELFNVGTTGARVMAGALPQGFALTPLGALTGSATSGNVGSYTFDVIARNTLGQSAVATFRFGINSSLPVTLVNFKANPEGTTTNLNWSTAEESNSERFDIERSQTGKNWVKIGSVISKQESSTMQYYSFTDRSPSEGTNLYRLRMVDLDKSFSFSAIESVKFANAAFVFPNPVRGGENLNLGLTDWSNVKQVQVVNATGKVVFEAANALSAGISTTNLSAGSYVVKVMKLDGNVLTHRFVRQ